MRLTNLAARRPFPLKIALRTWSAIRSGKVRRSARGLVEVTVSIIIDYLQK